MLKILLTGTALDLPADVSLSLIYENPLFINDRIPSAHSLTGTLPPTARNLKALGYPQRLNNTQAFREFTGLSIMFGPVKLINGVLTVTKYEGDIEYFIRGAIFASELKAAMNTTDQEETDFGSTGSRFTPNFYLLGDFGYNYREHVEATLDGSQNTVYGPIRIKDVIWNKNPIAPTFGGWNATSYMYFSYYNANRGEFMLGYYGSIQTHTVCYPLTKLAYLIDEIFEDALVANPFTVGELPKVVLTSTYHPSTMDILLFTYRGILLDSNELDDSQFMKLQSFASSMKFNDLLKEVLKMFCMSLYVKGDSFELKFNKDILESTSKQNWTGKLIGKLAHWYEPAQQYAYGYAGYTGVEKPYAISEVDNIDDLAALTVTDGDEKQVYVTNTNQLFLLKNRFDDEFTDSSEAGLPAEYEFETEVQDPGFAAAPGTAQSGFSMVSEVTPLPMNIHPYWWDNTGDPILFGRWYVPEWDGDRKQRPEKPNILLYQGIQDTLTDKEFGSAGEKGKYPFLTTHNVDAYGNRLGDLSLHWEGDDGLMENYHQEFRAYVESDKLKARGLFKLDTLDLKYLDLSETKSIKGIDWIIEKVEVTIRRNKIEPARVHLVKAIAVSSPSSGSGSVGGGL